MLLNFFQTKQARPQMKCAREIISVPGGDDSLRVNLNKKRELRMTQDIIDRVCFRLMPSKSTGNLFLYFYALSNKFALNLFKNSVLVGFNHDYLHCSVIINYNV